MGLQPHENNSTPNGFSPGSFAFDFLLLLFLSLCKTKGKKHIQTFNTTNDVIISGTWATFAIATKVTLKLLLARTDERLKTSCCHTNKSGGHVTMQFGRIVLSSSLLLTMALNVNANAMTHARRGPTSPKLFKRKPVTKPGQRSIDSARTTEIQTALIKSGYLSGEATGTWDTRTASAMEKLQSDNGWQTKIVPDSRAIIKLGLGPSQTNVANSQ